MSAPSKAKQRVVLFDRGDFIVEEGEIVDGSVVRPLLSLKKTPDETMDSYLRSLADFLNKDDDDSISFRNQLNDLPRNYRIDPDYLRNHFGQVGKISVQADQKDHLYTLRFHRRPVYWNPTPVSFEIGVIDSKKPPPRSLLHRFRNRRSRC